VDAVGAPEQVKFTVPEKSLAAEAVRLNVAVAPAATVADAVPAVTAKPVEPMPVRETVCGLSFALSVRINVPVRVPLAVGVKLTVTVQLAVGERDMAQLFVSEKSPLVWRWLICSPKLFQSEQLRNGFASRWHLCDPSDFHTDRHWDAQWNPDHHRQFRRESAHRSIWKRSAQRCLSRQW
jgi:hypothetical protein